MKKNLVKAVFTLTMFSLIDRILGFVFKVYLSRQLGAISLGIYNVALSVFFLLLTLTTSGIPLVVSKFTAMYASKKNKAAENGTVTSALILGVAGSAAVCLILVLFRKPLSSLFATKESMLLLIIMLPGVIFTGIYSAFRGSLWGHQRYTTVSVIELIEQAARIFLCVLLFCLGYNKLYMTAVSMTAACVVTAACCIFVYFKNKGKLGNPKGYMMPLIKSSVPITMIKASNGLVGTAVGLAVPFLLIKSGLSVSDAMYQYGSSLGMALPLLYIPITVVGSLAYVLIPTLSTAVAKNDTKSVQNQIEKAISFSVVVSALFVPVFWALGNPLCTFIFNNATSGYFMSKCAWLLIPLSVESITSSMMNSLDLEKSSFVNYGIGSIVLFGILFAFYGNFSIEILIIGYGISWSLSSILHIRKIYKKVNLKLTFLMTLLKSIALAFPSTFFIKALYTLVKSLHPVISLGICGILGFIFTALLFMVFGVIDFKVIFSKRKKSKKKMLTGKTTAKDSSV